MCNRGSVAPPSPSSPDAFPPCALLLSPPSFPPFRRDPLRRSDAMPAAPRNAVGRGGRGTSTRCPPRPDPAAARGRFSAWPRPFPPGGERRCDNAAGNNPRSLSRLGHPMTRSGDVLPSAEGLCIPVAPPQTPPFPGDAVTVRTRGHGDSRQLPLLPLSANLKAGCLGMFKMLGASSRQGKPIILGGKAPGCHQLGCSPSPCPDSPGCSTLGASPTCHRITWATGAPTCPRRGAVNPQIPPLGKSERQKARWVFSLGKSELGKMWEQSGKDTREGKAMLCPRSLRNQGSQEGDWGWDG